MNALALAKELRALFPAWFAALLVLGLASQAAHYFQVRLVLLVACIAPIVLGSMAVGHEYAHRTLTLMLSQPIGRGRLLATKTAVLLPMIAGIGIAASLALPEGFAPSDSARMQVRTLLALGPLCGLCLAPALSILCRSPLAAIVLSIAIPGISTLFAQIAGTAVHGFRNPGAVNDFAFAVTWPAVTLLCLAGALATWPLFSRLQAIEGQPELEWPAWLRSDAARRPTRRVHGRWSALIRKELRLQQLAYVIAVLYLLAASGIWALQAYAPEFPRIPVEALSVMYSGLLAVLIGSVASAEERQLGTLPGQLLQPMAVWQQWAVKVGTVIGLSLLLAIALPILVNTLVGGSESGSFFGVRFLKQAMVPLILLTSISLYVSSLSSSGIRAVVTSGPVIASGWLAGTIASTFLMRIVWTRSAQSLPSAERVAAYRERIELFRTTATVADAALLVGLFVLASTAIWFGFVNHRRVDRSRYGLVAQIAILISLLLLTAALPALVWKAILPLE